MKSKIANLTKAELLQLLEQVVGSKTVERPAKAPELKAVEPPNWKKIKHTCPKCGHTGPVDPDFGVRNLRGVEQKQSYCKTCRATLNYHRKARVNRSKHHNPDAK